MKPLPTVLALLTLVWPALPAGATETHRDGLADERDNGPGFPTSITSSRGIDAPAEIF
jgi:hypothetical protein